MRIPVLCIAVLLAIAVVHAADYRFPLGNLNAYGNTLFNVSSVTGTTATFTNITITAPPANCTALGTNYFMVGGAGSENYCVAVNATDLGFNNLTAVTQTSGQAGGTDEVIVSSSYKLTHGRILLNSNWAQIFMGASWNGSTTVLSDTAAAMSIDQDQSANSFFFKQMSSATAGTAYSGTTWLSLLNDRTVTLGGGSTQGITVNTTASCTSIGSLAGCVNTNKAHITGNATVTVALRVTPTASAPFACNSGTEGYMYWDSTAAVRTMCQCNSTNWNPMVGGGTCA